MIKLSHNLIVTQIIFQQVLTVRETFTKNNNHILQNETKLQMTGDMLGSSNFCDAMVNVFVLQDLKEIMDQLLEMTS